MTLAQRLRARAAPATDYRQNIAANHLRVTSSRPFMRALNIGRAYRSAIIAVLGLAMVSACSTGVSDGADTTITLLTHDSWDMPASVMTDFTRETGITVNVVKSGDAGALATKLALTPNTPVGDVAFGVDNTFASRALNAGAFADFTPAAASNGAQRFALPTDKGAKLTAVDHADVCLNIDTRYFANRGLAEPTSYNDLIKPKYRGLTVTPDPSVSSPGLAFMLGTIAQYRSSWLTYWTALKKNGLTVAKDWTDAYSQQFSGSSGGGSKPIVVSYDTSPPSEVGADGKARTKVLLDTCYRQVEYAGVLHNARNPRGAEQFVSYLLGAKVQEALPRSMYVYPVQNGTPLPPSWIQNAPQPQSPHTLAPSEVATHRDHWLSELRTVLGS